MAPNTDDVTNAFIVVSDQNPNDIKVIQLDRSHGYQVYLCVDGKPTHLGKLNATLQTSLMKHSADAAREMRKQGRIVRAQNKSQKLSIDRKSGSSNNSISIEDFENQIPSEYKSQYQSIMLNIGAKSEERRHLMYCEINEVAGSINSKAWPTIITWFLSSNIINTDISDHMRRQAFIKAVCRMSKCHLNQGSLLANVIEHDDNFWANYKPYGT